MQRAYNKSKKFNINTIIESKCTSKCFGIEPIKQEGFFCRFCDSNRQYKLCKFCYENCHEKCRKEYETEKNKFSKEKYEIFPYIKFSFDC